MITDISDRRQTELALIEFKQRLDQIALHIPGLIYQYRLRPDGTSCLPYASNAIQEIYGLKPEDVIEDASPIINLIHPEDLELVNQSTQESATKLTPWYCEYRICRQDGSIIWISAQANPHQTARW